MVFVVKEQQPKKSRLSIFRLGKSSKTQATVNAPIPAHNAPRSMSHPGLDSPPATIPRGARKTWQDARRIYSEGQQQQRHAFTSPSDQDVDLGSEFSDDSGPEVYQHERSSSLPLEQLMMSGKNARAISPHVLGRIETSDGVLGRHARQRSHFSIPDVVITACEEDGETVHVELEVPPEKRRSYVFARVQHASQQADKAQRKAGRLQRKKPTPLIDFGQELDAQIPTSPSYGSLSGVTVEQDSPVIGQQRTVAGPGTPATPTAPTASKSSSTGSPTSIKRMRKASFPMLFGRKSLDSSRAPVDASPPDPMPMTPHSPKHPQTQNFVYAADHSSSASLPSSSKESLPCGMSATLRKEAFRPGAALPSPPETPILPTRPLTKKELKAREKEEMALIKELEKIDKMVREHDSKAKKAAEKQQAKDRKRAAAAASTATKLAQPQQAPAKKASYAFKRMTIFSAASKAGPSANIGRRNSVMRKRESLVFEDSKMANHTKGAGSDASVQSRAPPREGRFRFPFPPSSPPRSQRVQGVHDSPRRHADQPSRPSEGSESRTSSSDCPKDSEELEQSTWRSRDWADLDTRNSTTFSSLITRNEARAGNNAPPSSYRFVYETDATADATKMVDSFSQAGSGAKRNSVQRALAMADAEESMLRRRTSQRRRGNQQPQGKRNSRLNSSGGLSSKRSSVASETKRRSLIRQPTATEGWEVDAQDGKQSLDMANWVDSLEAKQGARSDDEEVDYPLPSTASAMMQEMLHVDRVLQDLQAAQAASSGPETFSSGGSGVDTKLSASPRSVASDLEGLDDGQSTPRASTLGTGISRPSIPTISFTPASVESGLDQIAALGSPIRTSIEARRFSRPAKSERRRDSSAPSSPTSPRSPSSHGKQAAARRYSAGSGSPPTSSSSSSSAASSSASSPTTSATTTFSSHSSPVSPSRKAEFRISMAPFQPIDLFGVDVNGIIADDQDDH